MEALVTSWIWKSREKNQNMENRIQNLLELEAGRKPEPGKPIFRAGSSQKTTFRTDRNFLKEYSVVTISDNNISKTNYFHNKLFSKTLLKSKLPFLI